MDSINRIHILNEAVCISLTVNTLGKGMNPFSSPPPLGKADLLFILLNNAYSFCRESDDPKSCDEKLLEFVKF